MHETHFPESIAINRALSYFNLNFELDLTAFLIQNIEKEKDCERERKK